MPHEFYPAPRLVPDGLVNARFVLEPLTAAHVERDYEAVMASRAMLRRWSGTSWPADDFTLAGNLADLEMHHGEHQRREAFTYTVLSPDRAECLGCVYITPLSRLVPSNPDLHAEPSDAVVSFWTTSTRAGAAIAEDLISALRRWLVEGWDFPSVLFAVRGELSEQLDSLSRAGLSERRRVQVPRRSGSFVLLG